MHSKNNNLHVMLSQLECVSSTVGDDGHGDDDGGGVDDDHPP